jgi:hypothetical protein
MNKEQLNERIEKVCEEFKGQIPDLYSMVGVVIVGRLFGWRVVRLTASRRVWTMTTKWFGDPKELMPERGRLAYKSVGLKIIDQIGDYWDFIKGNDCPRDDLPARERKLLT